MTGQATLKPCPFCRSNRAKLSDSDSAIGWPNGYVVLCDASGFDDNKNRGCGASTGWQETKEDAIKAWNTRASEALLDKMAEALDRIAKYTYRGALAPSIAREALEAYNKHKGGV